MLPEIIDDGCKRFPCLPKNLLWLALAFPDSLHLVLEMTGELLIHYLWRGFLKSLHGADAQFCRLDRAPIHITPLEEGVDDVASRRFRTEVALLKLLNDGNRRVALWGLGLF